MNPDHLRISPAFRTVAITLIVLSLVVQLAALALNAGSWGSQGLADSQGNRVGFNNPLTREHLGLLIRRATVADTIRSMHRVEAAILMAHGLALALVFSRQTSWLVVAVFALPWSALGFVISPFLLGQTWTGESIVEGFTSAAASGVWFLVSGTLGAWLVIANKLWLIFSREQIPEQTV